jgi:hypothetical protein
MIRTKGEPGTGNVAEAVRHMKLVNRDIATLRGYYLSNDTEAIRLYSRENKVPFELALLTARLGRLPVVNFAAGVLLPFLGRWRFTALHTHQLQAPRHLPPNGLPEPTHRRGSPLVA